MRTRYRSAVVWVLVFGLVLLHTAVGVKAQTFEGCVEAANATYKSCLEAVAEATAAAGLIGAFAGGAIGALVGAGATSALGTTACSLQYQGALAGCERLLAQ